MKLEEIDKRRDREIGIWLRLFRIRDLGYRENEKGILVKRLYLIYRT